MPRKSAEALIAAPHATRGQRPLVPPRTLSAAEAAVWRELVAAVRPDHFRPGDGALLTAYCAASLLERQAARALDDGGIVDANGRVNPWTRVHNEAVKTLAMMATKLRLCPSSRIDAKQAGRTAAAGRAIPDVDWPAHFAAKREAEHDAE